MPSKHLVPLSCSLLLQEADSLALANEGSIGLAALVQESPPSGADQKQDPEQAELIRK